MHTTSNIPRQTFSPTHNLYIFRHNIHHYQPYQPILDPPPPNKNHIGQLFQTTYPSPPIKKATLTQNHICISTTILIMNDNIQIDPGPTSHILDNLPQTHIKRQRQSPTYNKQPQLSTTTKRHTQQHLLILQCANIRPNPGPMPNLVTTHPTEYKRRQTTYFVPSTIKFQPEYQHLA